MQASVTRAVSELTTALSAGHAPSGVTATATQHANKTHDGTKEGITENDGIGGNGGSASLCADFYDIGEACHVATQTDESKQDEAIAERYTHLVGQ